MAEEIRQRRIRRINEDGIELVSYPVLGKCWVRQFLARHPELQTSLLKTIEVARIKDTNPEALQMAWFSVVAEEIAKGDIQPGNMYNMEESGFSIGTTQAGRVIINSKIRYRLQAQPRVGYSD